MPVVNISKHRTPVDSLLIEITKVCIYINRHNEDIVTHANYNVTVKSIKIKINIKYYVWHVYRYHRFSTSPLSPSPFSLLHNEYHPYSPYSTSHATSIILLPTRKLLLPQSQNCEWHKSDSLISKVVVIHIRIPHQTANTIKFYHMYTS